MTEKYTAELGARIAALPDNRTADIWLEGASGHEPPLHLSVSIGAPNGDYKSYSFGAGGTGARFGEVYPDVTGQGQILEYIKTDAYQDAQAIRYIKEQWQADSRSTYLVEICRTYSMDKMRIFKIIFGNPTTVPTSIRRPPPVVQPQSWIQRVANWISGGASSTGSSTSR